MNIPRALTIGRPRKIESPDQLLALCEEYFESCWTIKPIIFEGKVIDEEMVNIRPYLVSGLCLHLGIDRDTLLEYGRRPEYSEIVKAAKLQIQNHLEERSIMSKNPGGAIFNLKCNHGFKEQNSLQLETNMAIVINQTTVPALQSLEI